MEWPVKTQLKSLHFNDCVCYFFLRRNSSLLPFLTKDKKINKCPGGLDVMMGGVLREHQFRQWGLHTAVIFWAPSTQESSTHMSVVSWNLSAMLQEWQPFLPTCEAQVGSRPVVFPVWSHHKGRCYSDFSTSWFSLEILWKNVVFGAEHASGAYNMKKEKGEKVLMLSVIYFSLPLQWTGFAAALFPTRLWLRVASGECRGPGRERNTHRGKSWSLEASSSHVECW